MMVEAANVLQEAARAAAEHDFTLLLADARGVVVHTAGGGAFAETARRVRLIEGACWTEEARGTNAIGTALTEGRPIVVHGAAHYARPFHDLVCYAAPIRDVDGSVIAVLDATSAAGCADPAVGAMVSAAALAMEATWRARAWAQAGASARALVERSLAWSAEPALIVEPPGRVVKVNPAARADLGPAKMPVPAVEALGVGFAELRAAVGNGQGTLVIPRWAGRGPRTARIEPLWGAGDQLLGVVVWVEGPKRRGGSPSAAPIQAPVDAFAAIHAEDPATLRAVELGRRVAASDLPIVLLAETGSGKERFAVAIHAASRRRDGPFVAVNCGSFAPELLASELFGYGPGAFTGAEKAGREGLLHAAQGGTLFLDEVGEMPPPMQVALLRVLEDGRYERVGERVAKKADVRVVCATCKDLPALVASGAFRQDLWFRLKGVVLRLPALRERTDRLSLARYLLARACPGDPPALEPDLERFIETYAWPGNVRELRSVLDVALVLADGEPSLGVRHLPPDLSVSPAEFPESSAEGAPAGAPLHAVEAWAIQRALDACAGNVSAAARQLGIARSTIYRVLGRKER
jgi:transcriptional regulator of acetoin/glycerol metabolism